MRRREEEEEEEDGGGLFPSDIVVCVCVCVCVWEWCGVCWEIQKNRQNKSFEYQIFERFLFSIDSLSFIMGLNVLCIIFYLP